MNIYYSVLNLFLLLSFAVLLRYSWYRFRYFLQIFQQSGYKTNEFTEWLSHNFFLRVITTEHGLLYVVLAALMLLMSDRMTVTTAAIILGTFVLFWFWPVAQYSSGADKKPLKFTPRMIRLTVSSGLLYLAPLAILVEFVLSGRLLESQIPYVSSGLQVLVADPYFLIFSLLLLDILIPVLFLPVAALLVKPVEWWIQNGFKKAARAKIDIMPDLKVIAITGSYGKTSTKFMLHALLKERYNVCMTPGSFNTPMGICKVINEQLKAHHQILILEMGARYPGNIRELCHIAPPDFAVITNIGAAHLKTFGSVEAIATEKLSLAADLAENGYLVLNGNDERLTTAKFRDDITVIKAGLTRGSVQADNIRYDETGTRFNLVLDENNPTDRSSAPASPKTFATELKLLGAHNVENFLLAVAVARLFSIRPETITLAAKQLEPVEHRLELKRRGGLTIIDDAFNSNPVGARNAVEILSSFSSGRRIIITPGMIELGDAQESENRAFGRTIAEAGLDLVILVGPEQTGPILEGIREISDRDERVRVVKSLQEANELVREYAAEGDVVLYENDLPDAYSE